MKRSKFKSLYKKFWKCLLVSKKVFHVFFFFWKYWACLGFSRPIDVSQITDVVYSSMTRYVETKKSLKFNIWKLLRNVNHQTDNYVGNHEMYKWFIKRLAKTVYSQFPAAHNSHQINSHQKQFPPEPIPTRINSHPNQLPPDQFPPDQFPRNHFCAQN